MKGTNGALMKEHNKRLILRLIRRGRYARTDIAAATGLTKASVTVLTDELMREGLITEADREKTNGVGRRPTTLKLEENARLVISFAMTRAGYEAGVYDLGGNPQASRSFSYDETPEQTVDRMAATVAEYLARFGQDKMLGVGVCCPGPVDYRTGKLLNPPNFSAWHNIPLKEMLEARCPLPVTVENISGSLALYEGLFGSCTAESHYAYVVVDEGIGSGIVVNGEIYRGAMGCGNELGHTVIELGGRPCACGSHGCLERYASIPAILEGTPYATWREAIAAGDTALMERECRYLSAGLVNLINLFDLNAVVLGGDIAESGDRIASRMAEALQTQTIVKHPVKVYLSQSERVRGAAAASAVLHHLFF